MCGIGGVYKIKDARKALEMIRQALLRRGPDGNGISIGSSGDSGLCHTRLAIIDPTTSAAQPMKDEIGAVSITYNGEIYNYRELKADLERQGYVFRTSSDTEVLLAGYLTVGLQFFQRLRGMFAFGILDERERRPSLLLMRDPLGIKPLYFHQHGNGLVFASQVTALTRSGLVPRVGHLGAAAELLAYGSVRSFESIIRDVFELQPGRIFRFCDGTAQCEGEVNWIPKTPAPTCSISHSDVYNVLFASVREALVADVPVGCLLSGGIDSTLICALAAKSGIPVRAYTLRSVRDPAEVNYGISNAARLGIPIRAVDVVETELAECFKEFIAGMDQPSNDGFNTWLICRGICREVKVLTSGLGGDELFCGYPHFHIARLRERLARIGITRGFSGQLSIKRSRVGYLLAGAGTRTSVHLRYLRASELLPFLHRPPISDGGTKVCEQNAVWEMTRHELSHYIRATLLRDSDSTSMYHGIELRPPLLHPWCIDLASKLPSHSKIGMRRGKLILRKMLALYHPALVTFPGKRGFELPYARWARLLHDASPPSDGDDQIGEACFGPSWTSVRNDLYKAPESGIGWTFLVLREWAKENGISEWR